MNNFIKVDQAEKNNSKFKKTNSFSSRSNGYILFEENKRISFINDEAMNLLKLDAYPIQGQHIISIFQFEWSSIIDNHIDSVIKESRFEQFDFMFSELPVQWLRFMIFPSLAGEYTVMILDITEEYINKERISETQEINSIINETAMKLNKTEQPKELLDLRKANIHLMQNEQKLRDIFEGAQVGIIILDSEGNIVDTNPAACSILGIAEEECRSLQVKKFVSDSNETPLKEHWSNLLSRGKTHSDEYMINRPDQTERIISFSASKDIYQGHHLIIFHDITLQKSIERSLINEKNVAEKSNRTKTNFLAMISHELRTPLNSIIGFAQILDDDKKDPLSAKQEYRLGKILYSSKHLLQLINNILELVRIDSKPDMADDNYKQVFVKDAIHDCIQLVKNNALDKKIQILVEKDMEDVTILVDPIRFQQVVVNLLANAIKYNKKEGSVTLYWKVTGHYLALFVKDTGIGIPKKLQEKIFEPFYRIFHADFNIEGTGIGLTLVKQNVLEMKGTVGVWSQEQEGSTFWVKIPI